MTGDALQITGIWVGREMAECRLASRLLALPRVSIPQPRLGAGDCRYDQALLKLRQLLDSLGFSQYHPA